MTDRSSEERSRFEKWALEEWHDCEYTNSIDTDYRDADTVKMWDAWQARAALEDRQEAPMDQDTQEAYNSLNVARYHELQDLRRKFTDPELKEHAIQLGAISMAGMNADLWSTRQKLAAYLEQNFRPRVPSEATPIKENANVVVKWPCTGCGDSHAQGEGCFAAPAPEVQGTPTKSNVAHQPWCASAPRPMDVPMGRGPYPCDCGTVKAAPAPVGTPQKETPQISEEVAAWRNLYPSAEFASVTKGAQGKEPQTFDSAYEVGNRAGYFLGEAAGRRSAITELQERAYEEARAGNQIHAKDVADWCAELQEKTK